MRGSGAIPVDSSNPKEPGTIWIAASDPLIAGDQAKIVMIFLYVSPESGRPEGSEAVVLLSRTSDGWKVDQTLTIGAY